MSKQKTRLWHSVELRRPERPELHKTLLFHVSSFELEKRDPPSPATLTPVAPDASSTPAQSSQLPATRRFASFVRTRIFDVRTLTSPPAAADEAEQTAPARNDLQSTRVMPIEQLFPRAGKPGQASASEVSPARNVQSEEPRSALRRGLTLAGALAIVAMALTLTLDGLQAAPTVSTPNLDESVAADSEPSEPAITPEPVADEPGVAEQESLPVELAQEPARGKRHASREARRRATPLARSAVDSLAAGDLAGAANLYEALASAEPARPEYAEAARILRARMTPSPSP